jgi:hypothetical protein
MPRLPSPPAPVPQAGEGRIRSRSGRLGAPDSHVQSAKADFGPLLPRLQSPLEGRGTDDHSDPTQAEASGLVTAAASKVKGFLG